jgi:PhoPQ-activated pathogenicity-related protein
MRKTVRIGLVFCMLAVATLAWGGALEDYVKLPDPSYTYSVLGSMPGPECMFYILDMTSQTWHPNDVDKPLWKHWVTIVVPNHVETSTALLIITGGHNSHDDPPTKPSGKFFDVASNIVSKTGSEDEIIAYTYRQYVDTGDATWPLLLPMTKAAVRAMDSAQDFLSKQAKPKVDIKNFVVTGASKRGWTTWLTGAVDPRVNGIAPMVIDVLNMGKQMANQKEWYGAYSSEVQDYTDLKLTDFLHSDEAKPLLDIVDPYSYRDKLTMPKLVLVGAGDQYWTLDAATFYFPDLLPEKYIRYQANGDHGLDKSDETIKALIHFFNCVAKKKPMPTFTWDIQKDGTYKVTPQDPTPVEARLWKAHSDKHDFRKITVGDTAWKDELLTANPDGTYTGRVKAAKEGYDGFYVELIYQSPLGFRYGLTTLPCVPEKSSNYLGLALVIGLPLLVLGAVGYLVFK